LEHFDYGVASGRTEMVVRVRNAPLDNYIIINRDNAFLPLANSKILDPLQNGRKTLFLSGTR
jgi:hypothetical protein